MARIRSSNVYASITTLVLAVISAFFCAIVVLSIQMHPKSKESYHLRIVFNLLMSDLLISLAVVFYYIIQYLITSSQLDSFCNFYLPLVIYLFLVSYIWTIMFAVRFRTMKKSTNINKVVTWKPPIKFGRLWIFPLVYVLPLLIFSYTLPNVTKVWINSSDTDQSCTFDHSGVNGVVLDLVYWQIPLLFTILINFYFYTKGLIALRNSPQSVLGRQMRRAGGYLSVLLIVWVPNIIYNFISIISSDDYTSFLNLCVVLSSSQGLLNVCVYVWSDPTLLRFMRKNAFFRKYLMCGRKFHRTTNVPTPDSSRQSAGMLKNSLRPSSRRRNTEDSMEDSIGSEDGMDLRVSRVSDLSLGPSSSGVVSVTNPLGTGSHSSQSVRPSTNTGDSGSRASRKSQESDGGPKGILVPKSRFSLKKNELSSSVGDLDQEKFVRFGEISTRFISSTTDNRHSERKSSDENVHDIEENLQNYPSKNISPFKKSPNQQDNSQDYDDYDDDYDDDANFYDSDEEEDVEIENSVKARDSSNKILRDLIKSRFSKENSEKGNSTDVESKQVEEIQNQDGWKTMK